MAGRWAVLLVLLVWSCESGESAAKSRKSPKHTVSWQHVTQAVNGEPIEPNFIYYTVYLDGEPYEDTYGNSLTLSLSKGCHMVYVTATRFDVAEYLESKPSQVVGVCRD